MCPKGPARGAAVSKARAHQPVGTGSPAYAVVGRRPPVVVCCGVLWCGVVCCAVVWSPHHTTPHHTTPDHTTPHHTTPPHTTPHHTTPVRPQAGTANRGILAGAVLGSGKGGPPHVQREGPLRRWDPPRLRQSHGGFDSDQQRHITAHRMDNVPTMTILAHRSSHRDTVLDTTCLLCGAKPETAPHLWACSG